MHQVVEIGLHRCERELFASTLRCPVQLPVEIGLVSSGARFVFEYLFAFENVASLGSNTNNHSERLFFFVVTLATVQRGLDRANTRSWVHPLWLPEFLMLWVARVL